LIVLLIWSDAIYPFGFRAQGFELDSRRKYLLGTGASDFFEYLQTHPHILPTKSGQTVYLRAQFCFASLLEQWFHSGLPETDLQTRGVADSKSLTQVKTVLRKSAMSCFERGWLTRVVSAITAVDHSRRTTYI
jgi:hypothetical protein